MTIMMIFTVKAKKELLSIASIITPLIITNKVTANSKIIHTSIKYCSLSLLINGTIVNLKWTY